MIVMAMSFVGCDKHETIEPDSISQEEIIPPANLKLSAVYTRSRVVSYALTYSEEWTSCTHESGDERKRCTEYYNANYINYASSWADCANFVSQCFKYGNLSEDATWKYNNGSPTNAWIGANAFYNYLTSKYSTSIYSVTGLTDIDYSYYLDDAAVGDLVFYLKSDNNNSGTDHVMIVTGVPTNGDGAYDIKLTGHTWNNRNLSFNTYFLQANPSTTYRIVKL